MSTGLLEAVRYFYHDNAIRYAIKFGVAGILAVFISLYINLPDPTWALFTVFVLMIAQYVGAIAEKSIFRMIGTIVGGLIGYLLTASLEQQPWIYLPLVGIVVAFSTAMFGQSRYPYAFLLCGLTTVVVISNGASNPDFSWYYALVRTEEVGVGIIATLLVQSLFWPRYASEEFLVNARTGFGDLRDCFSNSTRHFLNGGENGARVQAQDFPARISALRGLLDFGARESQRFRNRLTTYFEITNCLSRISSAIATLGETLPAESRYQMTVRNELGTLHKSIEAALDDLKDPASDPVKRGIMSEALTRDFKAFEDRMIEKRQDPETVTIPAKEAMSLSLHVLALDDIRQQIQLANELLDSLPNFQGSRSREHEPFLSSIPSLFWIKSGIKGGIAVVVAMILMNWLKPPGGTMFVLGTWVFTAMNPMSPGGQGDRRAYHYVITCIAALMVLTLVVLAGRPLLSSYAVMNTVIFTWLFIWGYLSFTTRGMTLPMQVGMLGLVGILGLNGQEPISFQAVMGFFFGIALATIVASVIQRSIWPSLPQWELRDRFVEFLGNCRRIVQDGPQSLVLWQKTRLALIPGEACIRINVLVPPICPVGEPENLREYLRTIQRVASHLLVTIGQLTPLLPPEHSERGKDLVARIETSIGQQLSALEMSMSNATPISKNDAAFVALMETWVEWVAELRKWMIAQQYPILDAIRILGLSGRYELAGRDILFANNQASKLRLPLYMGDFSL